MTGRRHPQVRGPLLRVGCVLVARSGARGLRRGQPARRGQPGSDGSRGEASNGIPPRSSGGSVSAGGSSAPGHGQIEAQIKPVGASAKQEVRYAQCMRASGEPNFPDPNAQGAFSFGSAQGIDPRSAQFQAAQQKLQ